MALSVLILSIFCLFLFSSSEARGGRGGGGRSSSGGGWRSSGSSWGSSSSSGSSGSSWSSSSVSSGSSSNPWSSSSVSSSSSGNPRRDDSFNASPNFSRDSPSPKRVGPFDSPASSVSGSYKPGRQTDSSNSNDGPTFGGRDGQPSSVKNARLWRRSSWIHHPRSDGRRSTEFERGGSSFDTNATYLAESPILTIYDMIPPCENLGKAMWNKYDELTQSGEMSSNSCQDDDNPDVCIRQNIDKVRCAVTEGIPKECMDKILAFIRGEGDICNEIAGKNLS